MNRVAPDKKSSGRLLGRVKKVASNAFTSKGNDSSESKLNKEQLDPPSHEPARSRRNSLKGKVSFLDRRRSSLINDIQCAAPQNAHDDTSTHRQSSQERPSPFHREKMKPQNERNDSRVSFLDKNRSYLIDDILGTTSHDTKRFSQFCLGDLGNEEHMVKNRGFEESLVAIAQLKEMDHAFILRSNGEWRYSVVVATSHTGEDPFIKFLVDDKGHTKEIPLRQWTKLIRLPAEISDEHLDSHADLMLSSMALDGGESYAKDRLQKNKSDSEVPRSERSKLMEDNRRMSESCLPKPSRRISSRRRQKVCPTNVASASFTSSRIPEDFGLRRDSGLTATTSTTGTSFRQRYSDVTSMKGSWRLSSVENEPMTPKTAFDIKFNQPAFLAALASINERSLPI